MNMKLKWKLWCFWDIQLTVIGIFIQKHLWGHTRPSLITFLCCTKGQKILSQAGLRWSAAKFSVPSVYLRRSAPKFFGACTELCWSSRWKMYFFQSGGHDSDLTYSGLVWPPLSKILARCLSSEKHRSIYRLRYHICGKTESRTKEPKKGFQNILHFLCVLLGKLT